MDRSAGVQKHGAKAGFGEPGEFNEKPSPAADQRSACVKSRVVRPEKRSRRYSAQGRSRSQPDAPVTEPSSPRSPAEPSTIARELTRSEGALTSVIEARVKLDFRGRWNTQIHDSIETKRSYRVTELYRLSAPALLSGDGGSAQEIAGRRHQNNGTAIATTVPQGEAGSTRALSLSDLRPIRTTVRSASAGTRSRFRLVAVDILTYQA